MEQWQKDIEYLTDKLEWYFEVTETGDGIFIEKYSPAGQDVCVGITASSFGEFKKGFAEYCDCYDPEEAVRWYNNGWAEPARLRDLLNDMCWVKTELDKLKHLINGYESKAN